MNLKSPSTPLIAVIALLAASTFVFYLSGSSERSKRMQKERELVQKQGELGALQAKIAEVEKTLADYRESSQKRINALEMAAREREDTARAMKEQVDALTKEKEAAAHDNLEKSGAVAELTDRLAALQQEKEALLKNVAELKKNLVDAQKQAQLPAAAQARIAEDSAAAEAPAEPFGFTSDKDLGAKIDPVNLGEIVVSKSSGRAARVQDVNPVYDFVILDVGERDGVHEGSVINLVRHNTLIGKAVVRHTKAQASAALILPEWKKATPEKGDLVTKF